MIRLVDYLTRLALLRSKLIRDIAEYEKVLWISDVPHERGCFTQAWGHDEEHEPDEWLEVQQRREPELPAVPAQCKDWVKRSSLRNKNDLPDLLPEITRQILNPAWHEGSDQPETITHTELLADHPEVREAWDRYIEDEWFPWTEEHNAWEKVHKVYSTLFAIYQEQLRIGEEYELVLGLGLLTWQTPTGQHVRRHLVVADAILEFVASLGKFIVRPHTEGTKLRPELDMLDIEEQPARAEETAEASLVRAENDPWENSCVKGVLQTLVHLFDSQGTYDDSLEAKSIRGLKKPVVEYAPALILRKRSSRGLTETLKRIKEQISKGEAIPGEFADLAETRPNDSREPSDGPEETDIKFGGEVFFPKPSNNEQRRIVDKIRSSSGILVQGPPGTGKSHTIANLICHLLATGQRTLITAKTPRALQVLEGLLPEELRPLCINLLGSGLEERRSLESSVGGILRKNAQWNENHAKRERTELEGYLWKLREEKAKVSRRLRDIRESETHIQSIAEGTYRGTAARIAEAVNRDRATHEWFIDAVPLGQACPLSANDLYTVLVSLRRFTVERRRDLELAWPEALPSSERFAELVRSESSAIAEERNSENGADGRIADLLVKSNSATIEAVCNALSTFRDTRKRLLTMAHSWLNEAVRDILSGNPSLWRQLLRVTQGTVSSVEVLIATADNTSIEFPDTIDIRTLHEDARQLEQHMDNGGKLGWGPFRPKLVKERLYVIKSARIGGHTCTTTEHFSLLADTLRVRIECEKAWRFWIGRSDRVHGPYALQLTSLKAHCEALENALSLEGLITKCREAIGCCSAIGEPIWADELQIEKTILSCRLALARNRKRLTADEIKCVEIPVSGLATRPNAHPVVSDVLTAIRGRDVDGFTQSGNTIQDLEKQRQCLQGLDKAISQLRRQLPRLTDCLERTYNEPYWEERIEHIADAWHWAQARYWIDDYIRQEDVPALAKRAKQIEDEINTVILIRLTPSTPIGSV
ncbi:MAG: AAA domain-containing protein [Nitrospira sp.]|nr:AAA domain-containing protein [Nitrospira sp.]